MKAYQSAIQRLPGSIRALLNSISPQIAPQVQEIRLRSGRPPVLVVSGRSLPAAPDAPSLTHTQLQECFYSLCSNSVHAHQGELAQGFFTLPGGHRVGTAGLLRPGAQGKATFSTITSLDIRVARQAASALPQEVAEVLQQPGGLLLAGPPGSGKTTLLRKIASELSQQGRRVTVVDERCELMPCTQQGFARLPPLHCDVLSGISKAEGILMALRSLSPQVILCDEVGGMEDVQALQAGLCAGAEFVASIHGQSLEALKRRPQFTALVQTGAFRTVVLLSGSGAPGTVTRVASL